MKKITIIILTYFVTIYCVAQNTNVKNVVLLNSYHAGFKWTDNITQGVIDALENQGNYRVFVEYMDGKRFQKQAFYHELGNLYKQKYDNQKIDGIICSDNYAFNFAIEKCDSIWGSEIPVSFCGVNNIDSINYDQSKFKGVREDIDIKNTIDIIFKTHPNTKSLIIISDKTLSGTIFSKQVTQELNKYYPSLPYEMLDGSDYNELMAQLDKFSGNDKAILLLSLYTNRQTIPLEMIDYGKVIFDKLHFPIYSFWDFLLDDFIVGGCLISSYDQGYRAASILDQQITSHNILPLISQERSVYNKKFDLSVLQKFHISENQLPLGSIVIKKNAPFWERYKKRIIMVGIMLIILIIANLVLFYNVLSRKKAEHQLKRSEERLELALNSANEGLWDFLLEEKKVFFNSNLIHLLGYKSAKEANINLNNWRKFIYKEDLIQLKEALQLHIDKTTNIFHSELRLIKKDGTLLWCALHGKITEYSLKSTPARITGVIIDIDNQKKFEEQLKLAKDKAEESDRLKSSFLANMSHEIRTPMNAIIGFSDILTERTVDASDQTTYLNQIKQSAVKLLHIINDIVDISKIESGQLNINNEAFDIDILIDQLEITAQSLLKRNNKVELIVEKGEILDGYRIYTDPFRLEQILLNLLSNAIKYTYEGFVKIAYSVRDQKEIEFKISDSGEGIAKEDQNIIFERFRQAEKSSPRLLTSGTGLGLSISKSLVELMHGKIKVDSELNKGSVFTVTFPLTLVPKNN